MLPIIQLALAAGLMTISNALYRVELARTDTEPSTVQQHDNEPEVTFHPMQIWDYTDPAQELCIAINFPAIILAAPLAFSNLPNPPTGYIGVGIAIVLFWYWFGSKIDRRLGTIKSTKPMFSTQFLILIYGTGLVAIIVVVFGELFDLLNDRFPPHSLLVYAAMILWPSFFATYFSAKLLNHWRIRRRRDQISHPSEG
jgi:hypothetical protein